MSCTRTSAWASRSPRVPRVPRFSLASLFARLSLRSPRFARSSFHTHHACSACLSPAPLASLLLTAAASPAFAPATRLLLLLPLAASPACGDRSFARLRSSAAHLIWLDRAAGSHCSLRSPLAYCWARSSCSSLACSSLTCFARLTTAACLRSVIQSGSSQLGGGSHTDAHTRRISSSAAPCPALHANLFTVFSGIGIRRKKAAVTSPNVGFLDAILAPILAIWPQYWPFGPNIGHLVPILAIWSQYWSFGPNIGHLAIIWP